MSCTNKTVLRRRRLVAAALALPLTLGMTGTALASGSAADSRPVVTGDSAPADAAALRAAEAGKAAEAQAAADKAAADKAEADKAAADKAAEAKAAAAAKAEARAAAADKPADKPAKTTTGSAAGAVSGQSAAKNRDSSSDPDKHGTPTSGPLSKPQPYSNADKNNTGANDTSATNPYKSTRDGSASGNGKGDGAAVGKPCAGCVGKADNKNPKGQAPGGSDHNAGYECDRNQGIGKTNPAHTGCKAATSSPSSSPTSSALPTKSPRPSKSPKATKSPRPSKSPTGTKSPKPSTSPSAEWMSICHATGSESNPFVLIKRISKAGVVNGHYGSSHQGGRDIIPAFTYKGVTYAAQGDQSMIAKGCAAVLPTTTSSPTPPVDVCPNMDGNQAPGTNCNPSSPPVDVCPNMDGNQAPGTPCGPPVDVCPDVPGNQAMGPCTNGGGGVITVDVCPDMPGNQPAGTTCTKDITGQPVDQPATNPVPVGPPTNVPPVIVPNTANPPTLIGGPAARPAQARPAQVAAPSTLPFTGTDAALLAELGLLLLVAGAGVVVVARRERVARAA